jgi:hypothetical protein
MARLTGRLGWLFFFGFGGQEGHTKTRPAHAHDFAIPELGRATPCLMGVDAGTVALPTGAFYDIAQAPMVLERQPGIALTMAAKTGFTCDVEQHEQLSSPAAVGIVAVRAALVGKGPGRLD